MVRGFAQAGELLGVGTFQRVSVVGPSKACVVAVHGDSILGTYTDPTKSTAGVEETAAGDKSQIAVNYYANHTQRITRSRRWSTGTFLADMSGQVIAFNAESVYDASLLTQVSRAIANAH